MFLPYIMHLPFLLTFIIKLFLKSILLEIRRSDSIIIITFDLIYNFININLLSISTFLQQFTL